MLFALRPGDLQALADMFCTGDVTSARGMLDLDTADLLLPQEYSFPFHKSTRATPRIV